MLNQEKSNDVFGGDDQDDDVNDTQGVAIGLQMINKSAILGEVTSTVQNVIQNTEEGASINVPTVIAAAGGVQASEKTIQDILEERQEQLKDLEQL